ncbi:MAG: hypothetical protein KGD64_02805 [Candidatus Heimdallarchaeota archaeon]|nr:hypothetical protein [Candidatus Heimdallarchaeota archaeon]
MTEYKEISSYLSDTARRMVLSQIISFSRSVSATELLNRLPITNRSTIYNILDRLTELKLIKKQEVKLGGSNRVFYSPNHELLSSDFFRNLLLEYEDIDWPPKLSFDFSYTWNDFPDCLMVGNNFRLKIVYGSWMTDAASTIDALYTPEITQMLTYWANKIKKVPIDDIEIESLLDYQAGQVKNENMLVIGSGAVNKITSEIMNLYGDSLPIRFLTPLSKNIYSSFTNETYSEHSDLGLLTGIVGLLPNPWDATKVIILCAGSKYAGTQASLKSLLDDIKSINNFKSRIITNHPRFPDIPVRILKAEGDELLQSMVRQKGIKIKNYSFIE